MAMKILFFNLIFLTLNLNAGDYRYEWANIGRFGLGEIDDKLLIYCGKEICITSIPAFESYWKWYLLWFVIIALVIVFVRKKK